MNEITKSEPPKGALAAMADRIGTNSEELLATLKQGVFKGASDAEFTALVITAQEYELNPLLKELYAFPAKGGGIVPIVGIDGWFKIMNRQPNLDGHSCDISDDGEKATVTIYLKDREHPVILTEYLSECRRNTEPWKTMPKRMIRNRAYAQAIRIAFGVSGIQEEDEGLEFAGGMRQASGQVVEDDKGGDENPYGKIAQQEQPPVAEIKKPEGKQTKERHVDIVELLDISEAKQGKGKTWWSAQVKSSGGATVDMNTFSSSMFERLGGFVGEKIKVTFTQTPRGGFALEDFEVVEEPAKKGGAK